MRKSFSVNLAAGAIGLMAATTFADIKVNDQLSLSGFLDMSAYETNDGPITGAIDQFEIDFLFKFNDKISARVDLAQGGVGGGAPTNLASGETVSASLALEQGFITYTEGAASLFVGKFLSATGFESAEPTGLYQYSASATVSAYGGYNTGIGASYTLTPMISIYGALFTSEWTDAVTVGDNTFSTPGGEAGVTLTPLEGLTAKAFYMAEGIETDSEDYIKQGTNIWASYAKGPLLVAAEVNYIMNWDAEDSDGLGFLVMTNYKITDKIAATLRYSQLETDLMAEPSNEFTVSPSYAFASNWWALFEYRRDINAEVNSYALETTITF
jgi:hypothetical protein